MIEVPETSNSSRVMSARISEATVPVSITQSVTSNSVSPLNSPNCDGSEPVSFVSRSDNFSKEERIPSSVGMGPLSEFVRSHSHSKVPNSPRTDGMFPCSAARRGNQVRPSAFQRARQKANKVLGFSWLQLYIPDTLFSITESF